MNSEIRKYFAGECAGQRMLVCFTILVASIVFALALVEVLWGFERPFIRQGYVAKRLAYMNSVCFVFSAGVLTSTTIAVYAQLQVRSALGEEVRSVYPHSRLQVLDLLIGLLVIADLIWCWMYECSLALMIVLIVFHLQVVIAGYSRKFYLGFLVASVLGSVALGLGSMAQAFEAGVCGKCIVLGWLLNTQRNLAGVVGLGFTLLFVLWYLPGWLVFT